MRLPRHLPPRLAPFALATLLVACAEAQEPAPAAVTAEAARTAWVRGEVDRLRDVVVRLGEEAARAGDTLEAVERELAAGRSLVALTRLWPTARHLDALAEVRAAQATVDAGGAAVASRLEDDRAAVAALRLRLAELDTAERPAVHRALAAGADNRADGLIAGGRGFAGSGDGFGGLYYAGRGRLETAAAVALLELPGDDRRPPPAPRDLAAPLAELERQVTAAYRRPGAEIDQHSRFIGLNATLKEAREQVAAGRDLGALLSLLEARRDLATIELDAAEATPSDAPPGDVGDLRRRLAAAGERLDAAAHDPSIARLFLEEAAAALDPPQGSEPNPRRAVAVLDHVLPFYDRLLETSP